MNVKFLFPVLFSILLPVRYSLNAQQYSVTPVPFNQVTIKDAFWSPRLEAHANTTLKTCISQVQDSTPRISNFEKAAGIKKGGFEGRYYDDSDVYKAMEGIAYSLINTPNQEYETLMDIWIDLIAASQQKDGYINTYYLLNFPDNRWTDMSMHEMYCGGHMIEAAIAYYQATGKKKFLDVATRFADHLSDNFGHGKRHWVPGHEEIELALVKLYHSTKDKKYLDLAHWLLEERGHGHGVGSRIWGRENREAIYCQDDVPVSQITDIKGHAVRAMYLFTGIADVAAEKNIPEYIAALNRVWEDVVYRNMYITGGIGSSKTNEGFTEDYYLPNKTAYCETCASVGMVFWNHRMNLLTKNAKYVDVLEQSLYNGVLAGISLEGNLFFYDNPLESDGYHHRQRWFGTACCPSNLSRLIPSVGNYIYLTGEDEIFVNLYIGNETNIQFQENTLKLIQKTDYPWDGKVQLEVNTPVPMNITFKMRIPGWCSKFSVKVNGRKIDNPALKDGYISIPGKWDTGDKLELILDMPVELISADPRVMENTGKRAVQRGPVVYCLEETDNRNISWDKITLGKYNSFRINKGKGKLQDMILIRTTSEGQNLVFIPYFAWDNREPGKMKVWIDYK